MVYKRKPASQLKKPSYAKKSSRQYSINSKPQTSMLKDGTSMVVSTYFEIESGSLTVGGKVGGSIRLDPMNFIVNPITDCSVSDGLGGAGLQQATTLSFDRLSLVRQLYSQFKVNSVTLKVTADNSELDNLLCVCANRADATPVQSIALMKAQAHKELCPDSAHRQLSYTHKFEGEEAEFHMFNTGIHPTNTTFLSVFQEIEQSPVAKDVKLRCDVIMSLVAKDSSSANSTALAAARAHPAGPAMSLNP